MAAAPPVFEIVGVHHENQGAVLMLEAAKAALKARRPEARLALAEAVPLDVRLAHGARTAWPSEIRRRRDVLSARLAARRGRLARFGVVTPGEVAARFDASGFAYGDFWGIEKLNARLLRPLRAFPERRTVLLPQAYGPFRNPGMAAAIREAMDRVGLAFVRDGRSMAYLEEAGVAPGATVRLAPDFTTLLTAPERGGGDAGGDGGGRGDGRLVVVPNQKVLDAGVRGTAEAAADGRARYLAFLRAAVAAGRAAGFSPVFLVHEGAADRALAEAANSGLSVPCPVLHSPDAMVTKGLVAAACGVVSSRFHGLVSALSSHVPALAAGWSHKYAELMAAYGLADAVVDLAAPDTWDAALGALTARMADPAARDTLARHAAAERARAAAMWDTVFAFLEEGAPR